MSDVGHGRRVAAIAYTAPAVIMPLPTASLGSPWLAVIANALGALLMPLLAPALATATYNLATASPCPFRFQMATEAGWDVGGSAAGLIAAVLSASGVSLGCCSSRRFPGSVAAALPLRRYHSDHAGARELLRSII